MTKEVKQSIKSQLITINWLAGTCALLTILLWIVIFSSIAFVISAANNPTPPITTPIETTPSFWTILFSIFSSFIFWLSIVACPIINLVAGIMILATDWKLNELQQNKLLWGLLAILLLGFIALFAFSISSLNILKTVKVENEDNYNKSI